jgi:hypothetical protein
LNPEHAFTVRSAEGKSHDPMTHRPFNWKSRIAGLVCLAAAVAAVSCANFTGVPASLSTTTDSGTVYAVNGAPLGAPTAIHAFSANFVPATADFLFDIAFDLDSEARIHVLPQRQIASGLQPTHSVALATVDGEFEAIGSVPRGLTFHTDTGMVVARNQVVIAQVSDANACGFSLTGTTLYAKIVVKAINRDARTLEVKFTVDPNCGFRSFAPGAPKD